MGRATMRIQSLKKNSTYAEKAFQALKRMIMLNQLTSGNAINERELSEQLGISRTPLRDALQLLEARGWVSKSGKSRYVSEVDVTSLRNDTQIRVALEVLAAKLMIDKLTDDDLANLEDLIREMDDQDMDLVAFLEADQRFHTYMGKISGNDKLIALLDNFCEQILRYGIIFLRNTAHRRDEVQEEHRIMFQLLKQRDRDGYIAYIEQHLVQSSLLLRAFEQGEDVE